MIGYYVIQRRYKFRHLADKTRRHIAGLYEQLGKVFLSTVLALVAGATTWLFREFFQPFGGLFFLALGYLCLVILIIRARYYLTSLLVIVVFIAITGILSATASFYIASDQDRIRYRTIDGVSYFEFPGQLTWATSLARAIDKSRLITVATCGSMKVARLPLLTYQPIFPDRGSLDKTGFRRFPRIRVEHVTFQLQTFVNSQLSTQSTLDQKRFAFDVEFGSSDASIVLTRIFPRSLDCQLHDVPLIPVLEVLPWNPDAVEPLVQAAVKVGRLRANFSNDLMSPKQLWQMQLSHDDDTYSPLFNVVVYSLLYQMFDGNVFAQMRAKIANAFCYAVDAHPNVFSVEGPFSAIAQNFLPRLVADFGSRAPLAAPDCHISEALIQSYQMQGTTPKGSWLFAATFEKCIRRKMPMRVCLSQNDVRQAPPNCESIACSVPTPLGVTDEIALEANDEKSFVPVVATSQNALVSIETIPPDQCPTLRDKEEDQHYVVWWADHANNIIAEPAECLSSAWRARYLKSQEEFRAAQACAAKRNIKLEGYEENTDLTRWLLQTKCEGTVNIDQATQTKQMSAWLAHLKDLSDQLQDYSTVIGASESRSLIKAFQVVEKIKNDVCGSVDIEACAEEYRVWQDYQRLVSRIAEALGVSNMGSDPAKMVQTASKLDNIIVDMAICDALQDEQFRKRAGVDRAAYCDGHGLREYRQIGSVPIGHSIERRDDGVDPKVSYTFEDGVNKEFLIKKFLDK